MKPMNEGEWVKSIVGNIEASLRTVNDNLRVTDGKKLPYSSEVITYQNDQPHSQNFISYETDVLVYEQLNDTEWKPRIIIEAKIDSVTTHDAITYSQKAQTHKNVHPYLRYGILLGNRKHHPLPGRLFRHGQHFDFMASWKGFTADANEWDGLIDILTSEYEASVALDEIIFNSLSRTREHFTSLHRPLKLRK
ncbi:MAG: hypothetical protein RIB86_07150 [Imperialibacter sp.]